MRQLTSTQEHAARLLGQGYSVRATAAELKVSERSIVRWRTRDDFRAIGQRTREERLADKPSVRGVLEDGLRARRRNGEADHAIRLRSAQLLLGAPTEDTEAPVVITRRIFVQPDGSEVEAPA